MPNDRKQGKGIKHVVNNSYWHEQDAHDNTTNEYVSGDVIGSVGELDISSLVGGGLQLVLNLTINGNDQAAMRIWFFRRALSNVPVENAPLSGLPLVQWLKRCGHIDVAAGDYITQATLELVDLDISLKYSVPKGVLYYILEAQATTTFTNADSIYINLGDWPD